MNLPRLPRSVAVIASIIFVAVPLVAVALFASGCGSGGTNGPGEPSTKVLTIEEALTEPDGARVRVAGALVATGRDPDRTMVLASVLLESYPPQAGGPTLPIEGLDLDSIVGMSSTVGQPDLAPVAWTDYWLVLGGVISDGVLKVDELPPVSERTSDGVRLRFSRAGESRDDSTTVWWAFDLANHTDTPLAITFANGQRVEVVLTQDGVEKYRWSDGKAFDQAIQTVTLQPGEVLPLVVNDTLDVAPGEYVFSASVTGSLGGDPNAMVPALTGTMTVR